MYVQSMRDEVKRGERREEVGAIDCRIILNHTYRTYLLVLEYGVCIVRYGGEMVTDGR